METEKTTMNVIDNVVEKETDILTIDSLECNKKRDQEIDILN